MSDKLTDRQQAVLDGLRAGKTPTEIGRELGITSQGVHGHMRRLQQRGALPKPKRAPELNGHVNLDDPFAAVRDAIAAEQERLRTFIAEQEREIAELEIEIVGRREDIAQANRALDALSEQEQTLTPVHGDG